MKASIHLLLTLLTMAIVRSAVETRAGEPAYPIKVRANWIDPQTGKSESISRPLSSEVESFSTPEGWEDALLILEP
jgi:hypothetical protein